MKRANSIFALVVMMAAILVLASPAFAAGAYKVSHCEPNVTLPLTGVTGTLCERTVFTPSGNENGQQHFKPDTRPEGKVFEQGALQFSIIEPSEQSSHLVLTPSGHGAVHNNFH